MAELSAPFSRLFDTGRHGPPPPLSISAVMRLPEYAALVVEESEHARQSQVPAHSPDDEPLARMLRALLERTPAAQLSADDLALLHSEGGVALQGELLERILSAAADDAVAAANARDLPTSITPSALPSTLPSTLPSALPSVPASRAATTRLQTAPVGVSQSQPLGQGLTSTDGGLLGVPPLSLPRPPDSAPPPPVVSTVPQPPRSPRMPLQAVQARRLKGGRGNATALDEWGMTPLIGPAVSASSRASFSASFSGSGSGSSRLTPRGGMVTSGMPSGTNGFPGSLYPGAEIGGALSPSGPSPRGIRTADVLSGRISSDGPDGFDGPPPPDMPERLGPLPISIPRRPVHMGAGSVFLASESYKGQRAVSAAKAVEAEARSSGAGMLLSTGTAPLSSPRAAAASALALSKAYARTTPRPVSRVT